MTRNFGIPKGVPLKVVNNRAQVTHKEFQWAKDIAMIMVGAMAILLAEWFCLIGFR